MILLVPNVRFAKYQGLANDFIVVDGVEHPLTSEAAMQLCDRRRGIGADGVLSLLPARDSASTFRMHVFNADGSVAEMCGNGLRCVVRHFLADRTSPDAGSGLVDTVVVDTDAGPRQGWLHDDGRVRVSMGDAVLIEERVEVTAPDAVFEGQAVSLGNPHLVLAPFDAGTDLLKVANQYGARFERHPRFPDRVNVGFLAVEPEHVRLVVYERGVGITQACGTGAAAAAVVSLRRHPTLSNPVRILLPGGALDVEVALESTAQGSKTASTLGAVTITGDAVHVFDGDVDVAPEALSGCF